MRNIIIIVIIVIILGVAFFFTRQYLQNNPGGLFGQSNTATINDTRINLIIADSQEERETGLSGRESLSENQGMLFVFENPGYHGFWMRNMKFPIDIVFLSGEKVVTIYENVEPPKEGESLLIYKPDEPSDRVLELRANRAKELELKDGDTISLPL